MNMLEVAKLCRKVKDCDKVIHEQQLGIGWSSPNDPVQDYLEKLLMGQLAGGNITAQVSI